jgi:hypothetical protein
MSLFYPTITQPTVGVEAFADIREDLAPSQAGILLCMARQLREDDAKVMARARSKRRSPAVSLYAEEEESAFPVPHLAGRKRLKSASMKKEVRERYGYATSKRWDTASYHNCADDLYKAPTADNAGRLMQMCMTHPKQLVRVAAAFGYHTLSDNRDVCVAELVKGLRSKDSLERDLAATGLARISPKHPALVRLTRGRTAKRGRRPAHTLTLVHGTWGSDSEWYKPPAGSFFSFIQAQRPDLYSGADFFQWSGGYSDGARTDGARELAAWVAGHGVQGLDIMGHSHGANVILHAAKFGMIAGKEILLSCPVHVDKYFPDFGKLTKPVYSVRVKMDLVILADLGGQRFNHPDIVEIVLPIWFDHFKSHDPQVWRDHGVAARVSL